MHLAPALCRRPTASTVLMTVAARKVSSSSPSGAVPRAAQVHQLQPRSRPRAHVCQLGPLASRSHLLQRLQQCPDCSGTGPHGTAFSPAAAAPIAEEHVCLRTAFSPAAGPHPLGTDAPSNALQPRFSRPAPGLPRDRYTEAFSTA